MYIKFHLLFSISMLNNLSVYRLGQGQLGGCNLLIVSTTLIDGFLLTHGYHMV